MKNDTSPSARQPYSYADALRSLLIIPPSDRQPDGAAASSPSWGQGLGSSPGSVAAFPAPCPPHAIAIPAAGCALARRCSAADPAAVPRGQQPQDSPIWMCPKPCSYIFGPHITPCSSAGPHTTRTRRGPPGTSITPRCDRARWHRDPGTWWPREQQILQVQDPRQRSGHPACAVFPLPEPSW